jgi:hypothetical protein
MVMTSTQQAARAAAQLHEAAQDVARVAAHRNAGAEGRIARLPMEQGHELAEDLAAESAGSAEATALGDGEDG